MTKHFSHRGLRTVAVSTALVLGSALLMNAAEATSKRGLPKDWSTHHVVFSSPGSAPPVTNKAAYAHWLKVTGDPRYILQQQLRAAAVAGPSMAAPPLSTLSDDLSPSLAAPAFTGPLPRGLTKALIPPSGPQALPPSAPAGHKRVHKDWSVGLGTGAMVGLGQFPATFTQTGSPCGTDYAVYNTGLAGSGTQATLVGFNNIYAACNGGVPTVYFAYDIGTSPAITSVALSPDGTQIAFIEGASGSAASLVVLRIASSGGSVAAPTVPTAVAAASYNGCTAPCSTTVAFADAHSDSYSSPFYDYVSDSLYVGDDSGVLHKFTGVFLGTPTEGSTVQVSSATLGGALGSPVYDANTGLVFIGDYLLNYASTCEPSATNGSGSCGYLYSVSGGTVTQSHQLDYQYGIVDSPIVDPSTSAVFAFIGADNTTSCSTGPCAGVFELSETFGGGASGAEVQVGPGYEFLLSGAFDNNYYTTATGNLYVVGGTGPQNNTLYQLPLTTGLLSGTSTIGPAVAANYNNGYYAGGLQVTEFYTGTNDYIFAGALMALANPNVGLVSGFDVTAGTISPATTPTGSIGATGGSSGIVIDNGGAGAQNIYYSTLLNSTCTTSGSGGCAVQVIQSAP